ncbi:MAG TPA: hypothetical protein VGY97_04570 [Solirubrobacteraceae bacterium]|jgi:hypothetical protein|nr:hypothetical protein [Solirubrobacteraceae bacterium]
MKAKQAYRLIVRRGGRTPAMLADTERVDHVEVVEIESGEVVLFWDCAPLEASRLGRALHEDLGRMEDEEFLATWSEQGPAQDEL